MSEDRPQYPRDTVSTNAEIAERLRTLSEQMADLGCDMEYAGGFGQIGTRGRMLIHMAQHPMDWAHEIEEAQG